MAELRRQPAPLHWILLVSVLIAFLVSGYKYLVAKDYDFLVEASCNPAVSLCYTRDCSASECPPNNLSEYRVFSIPAKMFETCADNSCADICLAADSSCTEIACSGEAGDACVGPGVN